MPDKNEHVGQAHHNRQFWSSFDLDYTTFRDWAVTGIFYEAVHWVEAYLATHSDHPTTHGQRNQAMARYPEIGAISADYGVLRAESENARYGCYVHSAQDIRNDLIPLLEKIETHVSTLLNPSATR